MSSGCVAGVGRRTDSWGTSGREIYDRRRNPTVRRQLSFVLSIFSPRIFALCPRNEEHAVSAREKVIGYSISQGSTLGPEIGVPAASNGILQKPMLPPRSDAK